MSLDHIADFHTSRYGQPVSLAHLSDPHLPPPRLRWTSLFFNKRLLSFLLWKTQRRLAHLSSVNQQLLEKIRSHGNIAATLVSGDITNFGTYEEYQSSQHWLKKLPEPAIVVPGNHDIMVAIPPEKSLHLWGEWCDDVFPFVRVIDHVAIIGLNSAIPTPLFTAYGCLKKRQLAKLETLLDVLGKEGYCRVIMIHHPPKKGLLPLRKSFLGTKAFARVLQRKGAEIVLHGHSHNATINTIEGTKIPLVGVGAASLKSDHPQKEASWNHLLLTPKEHNWHIALTRQNYKGQVMETREWVAPIRDDR
ncbi:metallophosphoesterase [Saccharibacter sp. 17.LH.SD]|uniref:metallophosphoesterase family protein n=1 Tax=Saccharibacter sp. 17.LH.SD TaxID=2689393 RepID=UPI0013703D2C|nr:metallophosphoesterase [Saccharibacter sp. 17.LH.SD]MXV44472.1 metallophosphoesterase [Saccharibacter sp. 17.LH.SD]